MEKSQSQLCRQSVVDHSTLWNMKDNHISTSHKGNTINKGKLNMINPNNSHFIISPFSTIRGFPMDNCLIKFHISRSWAKTEFRDKEGWWSSPFQVKIERKVYLKVLLIAKENVREWPTGRLLKLRGVFDDILIWGGVGGSNAFQFGGKRGKLVSLNFFYNLRRGLKIDILTQHLITVQIYFSLSPVKDL